MRDFPPPIADFDSPLTASASRPVSGVHRGVRTRRAGRAPRGAFADPDTRSPTRFLFWLLGQQRPILFWSAVTAVLEWMPGALGPYVIGRIVDEGITARDLGTVGELALIMLGLVLVGVLAGVLSHTFVVRAWLIGMYGPMKLVGRKAVQMGHVLPQRTPTGEVLSVAAGDADEFGALTEIVARAFGAAAAYLVIASLVLSTSFWLGVMVLVVAPMIVMLALPLLGPLQRREEI
jgi:ABC-type multidrug transport system fused ATPase/permease subunit